MILVFTIIALVMVGLTLPLIVELSAVTLASLLPRPRVQYAPRVIDRITVIVPAHNEEALITRTIVSLKSAADERTEIVVVAHNCSDDTSIRAAGAGARVLVLNDPSKNGKGYALSCGFDYALAHGADAVAVVDADSTVSANFLSALRDAFERGCEVVQTRYEMTVPSQQPKTRLTALALRGFNYVRALGRQRLGLSAGIFGNGFALHRSVLLSHPYTALSVVEDLEYHLTLVSSGQRVTFLPEAQVSAELPLSSEGEASQRSRWEGGRLHVAKTWLLPLVGQLVRGRLRVLEPMLDLAGLPLAYGVFVLLVMACLPLTWARIYAVAGLGVVLLHVTRAAWLGEERWKDFSFLAMAPLYLIWKLSMVPRILRGSSSAAAWVRTAR